MKLFLALKKVQNHSSSGSHSPNKKTSLLAKYINRLPQRGKAHLPPLSTIWSSLIHWYQQWVTIRHLPKCMCHKAILIIKRMAQCFHEYTLNVLKQKIKLEAYFVKNGYIALLYIDYHIIILLLL